MTFTFPFFNRLIRFPMPANLTPQYSKAEEEYRRAPVGPKSRISCLEKTCWYSFPNIRGPRKIQADLKTRLKEAREELVAEKKAPQEGQELQVPTPGGGTDHRSRRA